MRKSVFNLPSLMLFALVSASQCVGQTTRPDERRPFPITYGSERDGWPQKLKVRGTITAISYAPLKCGELVFPATLAVKLDEKVSGYKHPFVYLVVLCLYRPEGAEQLLNRRVEFSATKQSGKREPCFYDRASNEIDSGGVPFYCAEREELLQSVKEPSVPAPPAPVEFTGRLEEGQTYRAQVACDDEQEWRTIVRLRPLLHHAARIEWLDAENFAELKNRRDGDCRHRFIFRVVARETVKVSGQYRWTTTYRCRILAVEE